MPALARCRFGSLISSKYASGFGLSADLDPSIYFVCDRLENDDVNDAFEWPHLNSSERG